LNDNPEQRFARSIQGQVLRLSERRMAAIFLHDEALWVADFIDGQGELVDAITWFRFHCGSVSTGQARRRMVLDAATPLSEEVVDRIAHLRRPARAHPCVAVMRLIEGFAAHLSRIHFLHAAAMVTGRIGRLRVRSIKPAGNSSGLRDVGR
jgi:hypothetical protein